MSVVPPDSADLCEIPRGMEEYYKDEELVAWARLLNLLVAWNGSKERPGFWIMGNWSAASLIISEAKTTEALIADLRSYAANVPENDDLIEQRRFRPRRWGQ